MALTEVFIIHLLAWHQFQSEENPRRISPQALKNTFEFNILKQNWRPSKLLMSNLKRVTKKVNKASFPFSFHMNGQMTIIRTGIYMNQN